MGDKCESFLWESTHLSSFQNINIILLQFSFTAFYMSNSVQYFYYTTVQYYTTSFLIDLLKSYRNFRVQAKIFCAFFGSIFFSRYYFVSRTPSKKGTYFSVYVSRNFMGFFFFLAPNLGPGGVGLYMHIRQIWKND